MKWLIPTGICNKPEFFIEMCIVQKKKIQEEKYCYS
jgi:hypothetical protein